MNTLSKNIYFYRSKNITSYTFVAFVVKSSKAFSISLSMKEITIHFPDQNFKSQLNLILFFFQVLPFVRVDSP